MPPGSIAAMFPRSGPVPPVDIVLVGYSREHTERALRQCNDAFGRLPVRRRMLVLNSAICLSAAATAGWQTMRGSNDFGEFSGWQEGIDSFRSPDGSTSVLFANDTLGARRHLSLFRRWALRSEVRSASAASAVGFTDDAHDLPAGMSILGLPLNGWMSTYCFLLTSGALRALGGRLYDAAEVASCVRGGTVSDDFFSAQVSPVLRRHLAWWLFEGWHRSEPLTAATENRLVFKARCICAELLLTARCASLGIDIRDPMRRNAPARILDAANKLRGQWLTRPGSAG